MSAHTPSPWYEKQFGGRQIGGPGGYAICTMWGKVGDSTDDANARLIAAAPDLLAALRSAPIVARNEEMMEFRDRQDKWLREMLNPAISLATGETIR